MSNIVITKKPWHEVRNQVEILNIELFREMDILSQKSKSELYLFEAEFPFNTNIITNGSADFLFNSDYKISLKNIDNLENLRKEFSAKCRLPLCLISKGLIEVYDDSSYSLNNHYMRYSFPRGIYKVGSIIGTYETMDSILELDNLAYDYSAVSGNKSFLPILPNPFTTSVRRKTWVKKLDPFTENFRNSSVYKGDDHSGKGMATILDVLPLLIKEVENKINFSSNLLMIPSNWFSLENNLSNNFRKFVTEKAWIQATKSRVFNEKIFDTHSCVRKSVAGQDYSLIIAPLLLYVEEAITGKSPVLKFDVDLGNYVVQLKEAIKELIEYNEKELGLLTYDYLGTGEVGVLPIQIPPFKLFSDVRLARFSIVFQNIKDLLLEVERDKVSSKSVKYEDLYHLSKREWDFILDSIYSLNGDKHVKDLYNLKYPNKDLHANNPTGRFMVEIKRFS